MGIDYQMGGFIKQIPKRSRLGAIGKFPAAQNRGGAANHGRNRRSHRDAAGSFGVARTQITQIGL